METLSSPLFSPSDSNCYEKHESSKQIINPQASLENTINSLFPTQEEESKISRMRKHLGETAKTLSDAQVETIMTEFQFLIDIWLDEYEKEVFSGLTLKEALNEK